MDNEAETTVSPKVIAAAVAGLVAAVLVWVVSAVTGTEPPDYVLVALPLVAAVGGGYLKTDPLRRQ